MIENCIKIFVKDLVIPVRIGLYEHEKVNEKRQNIIVNATLYTQDCSYIYECDSDSIIDYDVIYNEVMSWQEGEHILLIETYMKKIVEVCFKDPRIVYAVVSISKPDIFPACEAVGVETSISREEWQKRND